MVFKILQNSQRNNCDGSFEENIRVGASEKYKIYV